MAFRPLVTVAGVELPAPSTYSGITSTLVDSARNVKGFMVGAVIRDDIAKIEMTWKFLTTEQWSMINKLFKQSDGGSFINSVTFFDQTEGDWITRNMYVNDRKAGIYLREPITGNIKGWTGCALNLIEV